MFQKAKRQYHLALQYARAIVQQKSDVMQMLIAKPKPSEDGASTSSDMETSENAGDGDAPKDDATQAKEIVASCYNNLAG